jgi:hypothetical protein
MSGLFSVRFASVAVTTKTLSKFVKTLQPLRFMLGMALLPSGVFSMPAVVDILRLPQPKQPLVAVPRSGGAMKPEFRGQRCASELCCGPLE